MASSTLRDQLDQEKLDHGETMSDLWKMIDITRRHHDEMHDGVFRYCEYAVCQLAECLRADTGL